MLVVKPSGTRDKVNKSGTVPEIPGQLETMHLISVSLVSWTKSILFAEVT